MTCKTYLIPPCYPWPHRCPTQKSYSCHDENENDSLILPRVSLCHPIINTQTSNAIPPIIQGRWYTHGSKSWRHHPSQPPGKWANYNLNKIADCNRCNYQLCILFCHPQTHLCRCLRLYFLAYLPVLASPHHSAPQGVEREVDYRLHGQCKAYWRKRARLGGWWSNWWNTCICKMKSVLGEELVSTLAVWKIQAMDQLTCCWHNSCKYGKN